MHSFYILTRLTHPTPSENKRQKKKKNAMSCLTKAACSVMLKSPECYNNALLKLNYTEMEQCLNFNTAKAQTNKKKKKHFKPPTLFLSCVPPSCSLVRDVHHTLGICLR